MVKTVTFSFILFFSLFSRAQNLIPNGGFEEFHGLPSGLGQWDLPKVWNNLNGQHGWPNGSPDYYHVRGTGVGKIPINGNLGEVYPYEGEAIMGVLAWTRLTKDFREYLNVRLNKTLDSGRTYQFTGRFSNGLKTNGQDGGYSIDSLGIGFSPVQLVQQVAEVVQPAYIHYISEDLFSSDWTTVTFEFQAPVDLNYLIIGNFRNDANTNVTGHSPYGHEAYYFTDDLELKLIEEPFFVTGDDSVCVNQPVQLIAHGMFDLKWVDSLNPSKVLGKGDTLNVTPMRSTTYYAIGKYNSTAFRVQVMTKPDISLGPDTWFCEDEGYRIDLQRPNDKILWDNGSDDIYRDFSETGVYWIEVENNCGITADTLRLQEINCDCQMYIPNSFTPNNDGHNECFKVVTDCHLTSFKMVIYNRWGEVVFESSSAELSWNGNSTEKDLHSNIYVYDIQYAQIDGVHHSKHGLLHLIR